MPLPFLAASLACRAPEPANETPDPPDGGGPTTYVGSDATWEGTTDVRGVVEVPEGVTLQVSGVVRLHPRSTLRVLGDLVAAEGTSFETTALSPDGELVVVAGPGSLLDGVRVAGVALRLDGVGPDHLDRATFEGGGLQLRTRGAGLTVSGATFTAPLGTRFTAVDLVGTTSVTLRDTTIDGYPIGIAATAPASDSSLELDDLALTRVDTGVYAYGPWSLHATGLVVEDVAGAAVAVTEAVGGLEHVTVRRAGANGIYWWLGAVTLDDVLVEDAEGTGVAVTDGATLTGVTVRRAGGDCVKGYDALTATDIAAERCVGIGLSARTGADVRGISVVDASYGVWMESGTVTDAIVARAVGIGLYGHAAMTVSSSRVEDTGTAGVQCSGPLTVVDTTVLRSASHAIVGYPVDARGVVVEDAGGQGLLSGGPLEAECVSVARSSSYAASSSEHATLVDFRASDSRGVGLYLSSGDLTRVTVERAGTTGIQLTDDDGPTTLTDSVVQHAGYRGVQGVGGVARLTRVDVTSSVDWALYDVGVVDQSYVADNHGVVGPETAEAGVADGVANTATPQCLYVDALTGPVSAPVGGGFDVTCGLP